jgi:ankyrin repeat protein
MLTKSVNDCLRRDDVDALKTYIDASNVLNKSEFESYVLHYVCFDRAIKCLDYVLSIGADVNCVDRQNDTALHYSAFNGQYKCTRMLLEAYANPNMYNDKKESPLNGAIKDDRLGIIKLLIDYGANMADVEKFPISPTTAKWIYGFTRSRLLCRSVCLVMIGVHKFGLASNVNGRDVLRLIGKHIWSYRMNFSSE